MSIEHAGHSGAATAGFAADEAIMLRVRAGETGLLAELFERHNRPVFGFFYRMTSSRELSEDLVQDVFLRILRYRDTYQPRTSFAAWMYGIARNAMIDQMRKRRPESSLDDAMAEVPTRDEPADERMRARQESEILQRALSSLPADKREVLILARYQDLRYEEIGRILGCEPNAVKQRVFRAVKALGDRYTELSGRVAQ
ncbi:MAG: sigma-70 family RNA polymerase sigma factor [Bryobacteraceae bacterium]|nr:sigma-70 family RNA polymerase sigma factor [Bryobacteraceae bacterium]